MHLHDKFWEGKPDQPKHQRQEEIQPEMEVEPAVQLGVAAVILGRHEEISTAEHPQAAVQHGKPGKLNNKIIWKGLHCSWLPPSCL